MRGFLLLSTQQSVLNKDPFIYPAQILSKTILF